MDFLLVWYLCCDICMYMISYYWNFFDKCDEKNVIFFLDNGEKKFVLKELLEIDYLG